MFQRRLGAWFGIVLLMLLISPGLSQAEPRPKKDGYLRFEYGVDGTPITLPGVSFTTKEGGTWLYGNVQTGKYNAPWPHDCSKRPVNIARPKCEFAVSGDGFAWVGQLSREGRILFTQGTASYVDASFSTATDLQIIAYSSTGDVVDVAVVRANVGSGSVRRISLEASGKTRIAGIAIRGQPNFWLMDEFATDAPGVPNERIPATKGANVAVRQQVQLGDDPAKGRIAIYTVVMANVGPADATDAVVRMPLTLPGATIIDASFSQPQAWVSELLGDSLTMRTGTLVHTSGVITATLRFQLAQPLEPAAFSERLTVTWYDALGTRVTTSNLPLVLQPGSDERLTLQAAPASAPAGTARSFTSTVFIPNEPVALWYDTPGGAVAVGRTSASESGAIASDFAAAGLAPGRYTMVAYGLYSQITSLGSFEIAP